MVLSGTDHLQVAHPLKRKAAVVKRQVVALAALVLIGRALVTIEKDGSICVHLLVPSEEEHCVGVIAPAFSTLAAKQ